MKLHREGYKVCLIIFVTLVLLLTGLFVFFSLPLWFKYLLSIAATLLMLSSLLFFRVPVRHAAYGSEKIFSGADGKVVAIEEVYESEYFNDRRKQVSVFMSVSNVHVNFIPAGGVVSFFKHHPGKHLFAWLPKASTDNERTTLVINTGHFGEILVRQIAGAFARRIVCYPRKGEEVKQGDEMGIIKFGSRVDLFLPLNCKIQVEINQHVRGGETLIATLD